MMKRTITTCVITFYLLVACAKTPPPFLEEYASIDLLVENGQVLDGLGGDARSADVVVDGDKIVFVGDAEFTENDLDTRVKKTIDAKGRIVSPGFIDLHAHGDPFETPGFENFLAMGVTTITLGQDGSSPEVVDLAEWLALAGVVGRNDRMIMSHMRNEDDDQLENSIAELLDQGRYARVHISHLKSVFGKGAARADEILGVLESARESGIRVTAGMYPYSASYTGKTLAELAHERETPFEDVLIDVIGPDGASGAYFVMNDELQARLLTDPFVGVCSDGRATGFHPRGHGSFARIIEQYVMQDKLLTLPEAIRKMTSFAAEVLGVTDRGIVREGMVADLLIFDPAHVHATATYPNPLQLATGFDVVIVNGKVAREDGRQSDGLFGGVLWPGNQD